MMQKKNLAALVATLFAVPFAAHADVTLYGFISASVQSASATGATGTGANYSSRMRVADDNSRIGFKGFEDLGNGTKAIWQIENSLKYFEQGGVNDTSTSATLATRNTYVGLDNSSFGKVMLGYYDSAYKVATNTGDINPLPNTDADTNGPGGITGRGETRMKNSIHYYTPVFSGLQGAVSYGADETRTSGKTQTRWSFAGTYNNGGFHAALGYDKQNDTSIAGTTTLTSSLSTNYSGSTASSGKSITFYKGVTSYLFSTGTLIAAGYEMGHYDYTGTATGFGSTLKQSDFQLTVGQTFGKFGAKLSYASLGKLDGAANPDNYKAKQWVLAGTYDWSKTTQLYAYYSKITNNSTAAVNLQNVPVYTSVSGTTGSLANGVDPRAVGVGIKVSF